MKVELTQSEIENLAELIEFDFIDIIRKDTSIDNIDYIASMMNAYQELKKHTTNKEHTNYKPYLSCDMDNKNKGEF